MRTLIEQHILKPRQFFFDYNTFPVMNVHALWNTTERTSSDSRMLLCALNTIIELHNWKNKGTAINFAAGNESRQSKFHNENGNEKSHKTEQSVRFVWKLQRLAFACVSVNANTMRRRVEAEEEEKLENKIKKRTWCVVFMCTRVWVRVHKCVYVCAWNVHLNEMHSLNRKPFLTTNKFSHTLKKTAQTTALKCWPLGWSRHLRKYTISRFGSERHIAIQ